MQLAPLLVAERRHPFNQRPGDLILARPVDQPDAIVGRLDDAQRSMVGVIVRDGDDVGGDLERWKSDRAVVRISYDGRVASAQAEAGVTVPDDIQCRSNLACGPDATRGGIRIW
jgi:hypothetical protein